MSDLPLKDKKIVVGISGSIALYKICEIVRLFKKEGADVFVVATDNALKFVGEITWRCLTGNEVLLDIFNSNISPNPHITLMNDCDLLLVAPASANCIAKFANGIADDALSTCYLAQSSKVLIAPAMHTNMWNAPSMQRNVKTLKEDSVEFIGPISGQLACGDVGEGKMADVIDVFNQACKMIAN